MFAILRPFTVANPVQGRRPQQHCWSGSRGWWSRPAGIREAGWDQTWTMTGRHLVVSHLVYVFRPQGKRSVTRSVGQLHVAIGDDLVLADAGGTARAPGHHIGAAVEPAVLPTLLDHLPDHVVVFVGEGEIAAAQLGQTKLTDHLLDRIGHGFAIRVR